MSNETREGMPFLYPEEDRMGYMSPRIYGMAMPVGASSRLAPPGYNSSEGLSPGNSSISSMNDMEFFPQAHVAPTNNMGLNPHRMSTSLGATAQLTPIPPDNRLPHHERYPDLWTVMGQIYIDYYFAPGGFDPNRLGMRLRWAFEEIGRLNQNPGDTGPSTGPHVGVQHETKNSNNSDKYTCRYCNGGNLFSRGTLKRHISAYHYPDYKYKCPLCIYYNYRKDKLRSHWNGAHRQAEELSGSMITGNAEFQHSPTNCHFCHRQVHGWDDFFQCVLDHCRITENESLSGTHMGVIKRDQDDDEAGDPNNFHSRSQWNSPFCQNATSRGYPYTGQSQGATDSAYSGYNANHVYRRISDPSELRDIYSKCIEANIESDISHKPESIASNESLDPDPSRRKGGKLRVYPDHFKESLFKGAKVFGKGISPFEENKTPQTKCQGCGHVIDACTKCRAVFRQCHKCADRTAQQINNGNITAKGLGHDLGDVIDGEILLRSNKVAHALEGDEAGMATSGPKPKPGWSTALISRCTENIRRNYIFGIGPSMPHKSDLGRKSAEHQLQLLRYFEQYLCAWQKKGRLFNGVHEFLMISKQEHFFGPCMQEIEIQKVILATDKRPEIPGEHIFYLAREMNHTSFDSDLEVARGGSSRKRVHLRVRIRAIAGVLALRASVAKAPPAPDNHETHGCELSIPIPLISTKKDVLNGIASLVYLLVFLLGFDPNHKTSIYVISGAGNWSIPRLTYRV